MGKWKKRNKTNFLDNVEKSSGCWLWTGCLDPRGYGQFSLLGIRQLAHRYSYQKFKGIIDCGMWVLHRCDNPACVNPDHLFLGTHEDNMADMVSKGRSLNQSGEKNHNARLDQNDVVAIRAEIANGTKQRDLARRYSVSENQIKEIKYGRRWACLRGD